MQAPEPLVTKLHPFIKDSNIKNLFRVEVIMALEDLQTLAMRAHDNSPQILARLEAVSCLLYDVATLL